MASKSESAPAASQVCPDCKKPVMHNDSNGMTVCQACGWVGEEGMLRMDVELAEQPIGSRGGTSYGPTGTLVKASETGGGIGSTDQSGVAPSAGALRRPRLDGNREGIAKRQAYQILSRIVTYLHMNPAEFDEARNLLRKSMDGRWRCGRWAELMVASVAYIVCRQNSKSYTLLDVADSVQCNVYTLGRVYTKLVQDQSLHLPHVDPSLFVERACGTLNLGSKARAISEHAMSLVKLAKGEWLVTGRRPEAVAAAAILMACDASDVILEDGLRRLAQMLHVGLKTVLERQRELSKAALDLAKSMPWGKDVTPQTLHSFLPFILRHLEYARFAKAESSTPAGTGVDEGSGASAGASAGHWSDSGDELEAEDEAEAEAEVESVPSHANAPVNTAKLNRAQRIRRAQARLSQLFGVSFSFEQDADVWKDLGLAGAGHGRAQGYAGDEGEGGAGPQSQTGAGAGAGAEIEYYDYDDGRALDEEDLYIERMLLKGASEASLLAEASVGKSVATRHL